MCPVLAWVVLCSPGVVLERPAAGGGRHRDKLVSSILGTRSHFFKSRESMCCTIFHTTRDVGNHPTYFRRKGEELLLRLAGSPVGLVELAE